MQPRRARERDSASVRMRIARELSALLVVAACGGGGKAKAPHDASARPGTPDDARPGSGSARPPADAGSVAVVPPDAPTPVAQTGDAQIRLEWKDVPVAARASPGRTACNTPRAPAVAPTTTWGIPDAIVVVADAPELADAPARIVLAGCSLVPAVATGRSLVVASQAESPAKVTLARRATLGKLDALEAGTPRPIRLPVAGHAVTATLDAGGVYELVAGDASAWVVAGPAAITDVAGVALVHGLAPGKHAVAAWLPPRAGQAARRASGEVTVVAGELAELTLQLVP